MIRFTAACLMTLVACLAQEGPKLLPGEGLCIAREGGAVASYGETGQVRPMGSLAKLVWLRHCGDDWATWGVSYKCKGEDGGTACWLKKGHGRVDLAEAVEQSCNLAFLAWARHSMAEEGRLYGPGAARIRMEEVFRPFVGRRWPAGEGLPALDRNWIGDGDLMQTSPTQFTVWLAAPEQERLVNLLQRLLDPIYARDPGQTWWFKTGTAPVPSDPGATSAWVAGGNGKVLAVLYLPRGRGKAEGIARFKELMGLTKR